MPKFSFLKLFEVIIILLFSVFIQSCQQKPCHIEDRKDQVVADNTKSSSDIKDLTKKLYIYKLDGSLQCGLGAKIDLSEMRKELGSIEVFSSENKHDGLMRVQVCGHPTGYCNVYQINAKDLDKALQLGFKKWIRD